MVIDADGLNLISRNLPVLKKARAPVVLTPHPGEMARLTGLSIGEIQKRRVGTAREFSEKWGVTTVLKEPKLLWHLLTEGYL